MSKQSAIFPNPVPVSSAQVRTNQIIETIDGIELIADLYVPWGTPPFPAIMEISPYGAQHLAPIAEIYATRGFLFLAVDTRGRYRSSGNWEPNAYDQSDGHAVIRWLAEHELCNSRIGSRGHSYSGYNQLLTAIDAPPQLKAMVVAVAPGDPFDNVPFQGGAYHIGDLLWLMSVTGRVNLDNTIEDFGIKRFGSSYLYANPFEEDDEGKDIVDEEQGQPLDLWQPAVAGRPFRDVDLRLGLRQDIFRQWLAHWQYDDYWQQRSVGKRIDCTAVPTLFISGWWDDNGRGATAFYRSMRSQAADGAREQQRLVMGAWNHSLQAPDCTQLPAHEAALIKRASLRDELNDEFAWFDQHLLDIDPGPSMRSRVNLFVTGLYRWLETDDWPPQQSQVLDYYLLADEADNVGRIQTQVPDVDHATATYRFDPLDPTPFAPESVPPERIPFDNAALARADLLAFNLPPMVDNLWLIGELRVVLFASADVKDFDLCAKLLDVYPDGRAIYLSDGIVRARFRNGWHCPTPVE
ncbi:CocE/NonD family hydrolase, partial [Kaarinaea lacus]